MKRIEEVTLMIDDKQKDLKSMLEHMSSFISRKKQNV